MTPKRDHDVGYKNPPWHTRFTAGRSGNPRGHGKSRPKNIQTIIDRVLDRKIRVVEGGVPTSRTIRHIIISQFAAKAIGGDNAALKVLLEFKEYAKSRSETPAMVVKYIPDKKMRE